MNAERFEQLLDAYGASPGRWPQGERAAAEAFAAASPDAAARLEAARALDGALDAWKLDAGSAILRERITAGAPKPRLVRSPPRRVWWAGAGLAAACAMGMVVGANAVSLGLLAAPTTADPIGAALTSSDNLSVFGTTLDLGKTS
jgi:hypothetical protein